MTEHPNCTSESFRQRFRSREVGDVCILAFDYDFTSDDLPLLNTAVEPMIRAGMCGFVFELTQLRHRCDEAGLGLVIRCMRLVYDKGGRLNWLHGTRFVQEWQTLHLLGLPPENFETEHEAVEGLRTASKAARIRIDLVQRLTNCGVSAADIANVAGLFESDVRRIADGQQEASDSVAILISSALDFLGRQTIPPQKAGGPA